MRKGLATTADRMSIELPIRASSVRPVRMAPTHQQALLIALLAGGLSATIAMIGIGQRPFWLDEAYTHWFSGLGWARLWLETPNYEPHPPFYYSILKIWRGFAGDGPAALRVLSALASASAIIPLTLAGMALIRLRLVRRPILFLSALALIAAISPRLLLLAQDARPYALLFCAYAAAICGWLRLTLAFRSDPRAAGDKGDWFLLGAATLAVLWLHALGILYAGALCLTLLLSWGDYRLRPVRRPIATFAIVGLLYLPCLAMMVGRVGDWGSGWLLWNPARLPASMLDLFAVPYFQEPITPLVSRVLPIVLIYMGLRGLFRDKDADNRKLGFSLAALIFLPPLAAAIVSQLGLPVFLPRTLIAIVAPAFLVMVLGLDRMAARPAFLATGALALLFLVSLVQAFDRPPPERWDRIAAHLETMAAPGDAIWLYPNDVALPLSHVLPEQGRPMPAPYPAPHVPGPRPGGSPAVPGLIGEGAASWSAQQDVPASATIFLVRSAPEIFDPEDEVLETIAKDRQRGPAIRWGNFEVIGLHPTR